MDTIQLKIEKYQKILVQYIEKLAKEKNDGLGNNLMYQAIVDTKGYHFQLVKLGWYEKTYIHDVLIHLDINSETGNIWVQKNDTEIPLDVELAEYGIPKKHFVLGFRPPYMHGLAGFAIA